MSSYFYLEGDHAPAQADFIEKLSEHAEKNKCLVYVLNRPLTDLKYTYSYKQAIIVLSPRHKIAIIDCGNNENEFGNYVEDIIEDIGSISDKYLYKDIIGRPRQWRSLLIEEKIKITEISNISQLFDKLILDDEYYIKKLDLLISLFIGSINDMDRVKEEPPRTNLDKVKQKIQLFDGDQTRFVYQNLNQKRISIQGLSGTGKTELILHKLKELYVKDPSSIIYFTCHNKILADNLRKRIPDFFNFMKVEQQIEWEKRLWCTNAWGSEINANSGAYRYICAFYEIPFFRYSYHMSFGRACKLALEDIKAKFPEGKMKFAFTYMFIDESQDFDESFFELCQYITEKNIYVAGDIFQSIFDENFSTSIAPDFLLGKCYRTDPKTLMFAHALGMGLFEDEKLRWLDQKEWEECGYNVKVNDHKFYLSREPLRRFEDLDENFESIEIKEVQNSNDFADTILKIIAEIREENETVLPEDIAVILLDRGNTVYAVADMIELKIKQKIGWDVNKAYETKEKIKNAIFVSNRNNVKGLEFPFVICVTRSINRGAIYRNSLYTMLTRSFIKSFLVLPGSSTSGLTEGMKAGLEQIVQNKEMIIDEPSEPEKEIIRTRFKSELKKKSHYEIMMGIFKELNIDKNYHSKFFDATKQMDITDSDVDTLKEFVKDNLKYIK